MADSSQPRVSRRSAGKTMVPAQARMQNKANLGRPVATASLWPRAHGAVVQTKPIPPSLPVGTEGPLCKTKPIWPAGVVVGGAHPTGLRSGPVVQTKPIGLDRAGKTIPKALGLEAATRHGARGAKQGQLPHSDARDKCFMEKRLWQIGPAQGVGETKPIGAGIRFQGSAT